MNHCGSILCSLWAVVLAACGSAGETAAPADPVAPARTLSAIAIAVSPPALQVGMTATVRATALDQFGEAMSVGTPTWTSSAPSVAPVTETGIVEALSEGAATLTATMGGKQGHAAITVQRVKVAVVSVAPSPVAVARGETHQLQATVRDYAGRVLSDRLVLWSSADPSRASVSANGVVMGVGQGEVAITATSEGVSGSAVVAVAATAGAVATIGLSPLTATVRTGDTLRLVATVRDVAGNMITGREAHWTLSVAKGTGVATLTQTGVLVAESAGEVAVEAALDGQRGSAAITVVERVDEAIVVSVALPKVDETLGDSLEIKTAVRSPRPIVSVVASVGKVRLPLREGVIGARGGLGWLGVMDLRLVRYGPYTLTITATDDLGARGISTIPFKRGPIAGEGSSNPPRNK